MSEWLELDPTKLNVGTQKEIRGVQVNVHLSPYDVPDGVRGYFDKKLNRFVIEFRYMGQEDPNESVDRIDHQRHVRAIVGRHSRRLYRIEIDTISLQVKAVGLQFVNEIDAAFQGLEADTKKPLQRDRLHVTREAFKTYYDKLSQELGAT